MSSNQKGFGIVGVLLVIVVLAGIGGVGYFVYNSRSDTADEPSTSTSTSNSSETESAPQTQTSVDYIEIKEWGVKVKLRDASKLTATVNNKTGNTPAGAYEGEWQPEFKSEFLQDKTCDDPGLGLYRSMTNPGSESAKKVGDYYYFITGGPGACGNDADDALKSRFIQDFTTSNITAL